MNHFAVSWLFLFIHAHQHAMIRVFMPACRGWRNARRYRDATLLAAAAAAEMRPRGSLSVATPFDLCPRRRIMLIRSKKLREANLNIFIFYNFAYYLHFFASVNFMVNELPGN